MQNNNLKMEEQMRERKIKVKQIKEKMEESERKKQIAFTRTMGLEK